MVSRNQRWLPRRCINEDHSWIFQSCAEMQNLFSGHIMRYDRLIHKSLKGTCIAHLNWSNAWCRSFYSGIICPSPQLLYQFSQAWLLDSPLFQSTCNFSQQPAFNDALPRRTSVAAMSKGVIKCAWHGGVSCFSFKYILTYYLSRSSFIFNISLLKI